MGCNEGGQRGVWDEQIGSWEGAGLATLLFWGKVRWHRSTWTCAADLAGSDFSRPVAAAGAFLGVKGLQNSSAA